MCADTHLANHGAVWLLINICSYYAQDLHMITDIDAAPTSVRNIRAYSWCAWCSICDVTYARTCIDSSTCMQWFGNAWLAVTGTHWSRIRAWRATGVWYVHVCMATSARSLRRSMRVCTCYDNHCAYMCHKSCWLCCKSTSLRICCQCTQSVQKDAHLS